MPITEGLGTASPEDPQAHGSTGGGGGLLCRGQPCLGSWVTMELRTAGLRVRACLKPEPAEASDDGAVYAVRGLMFKPGAACETLFQMHKHSCRRRFETIIT